MNNESKSKELEKKNSSENKIPAAKAITAAKPQVVKLGSSIVFYSLLFSEKAPCGI